ncbi:ribosome recycling factor [Alphaproteobacteria bacterium]|nr:ribosome recycling factor [Alphaproteobacteria bacterium]
MIADISDNLRKKMNTTIESLKKDFSGLRAGRASTSLLDNVMVEMYGSMMPLSQVGTVSAPESRMLSIQVWDKSAVKSVEKAIMEAGLGLNPVSDGQLIRLPLPDLSEERRKELVKIAGKYAEASKVSVRNIRREGMDSLKSLEKSSDISEDDQRRGSEDVQKITDDHIKKVDELFSQKEQDIMSL